MKIYIVADGEGISGVVNSEEMHHTGKYFDQFRRLMTMDVNAAIEVLLKPVQQRLLSMMLTGPC